jgi:hypothetical protein
MKTKHSGRNRFMYEYLHIDIHVTRWDYLQRRLVCSMLEAETLKNIEVMIGFLIEDVTDNELPERLFGSAECANIDWDVPVPLSRVMLYISYIYIYGCIIY